jgi:hypothetical protein
MVEGEELGAIARRIIDSNQLMTFGTAEEKGVPESVVDAVEAFLEDAPSREGA